MFDKMFFVIMVIATISLFIFTVIFGILGDLNCSLLCFILAIECVILLDLEDINRKVESK